MEINEKKWKRMRHGPLDKPLVDYLEIMFDRIIEKGYSFKVCVGTDSQRLRKGYKFATVIVVAMEEDLGGGVMVGRGAKVIGCNYFSEKYPKNKDGVKERMLFEVANSIDAAYHISPLLDLYDVKLEIHADINADVKWESNKALSEAVGYILGMGYDFKVKPDAWAATKSADKVSRS